MTHNLNTVKIKRRKTSYHHGNLREALIAAAIAILEKDGLQALSLRGVAAHAGVTQTAPYTHFKDKRALLAAVAEVGYSRLYESMATQAEAGKTDQARFLGIGRGYVRFALSAPGLFGLMFSTTLGPLGEHPDLQAKADAAYGFFIKGLERVADKRRFGKHGSMASRVAAWSLIHGLSVLLVERRLPIEREREGALIETVTAFYVSLLERAQFGG